MTDGTAGNKVRAKEASLIFDADEPEDLLRITENLGFRNCRRNH